MNTTARVTAHLTTRTDKTTGRTYPAIKLRGGTHFIFMELTHIDSAYALVHRLHDLIEEHERRHA